MADSAEHVYWADRESRRLFAWNRRDLQLVRYGSGLFLLAKPQSGAGARTFYIADAAFQVQRTFTLDLGNRLGLALLWERHLGPISLRQEKRGCPITSPWVRLSFVT